MLIRRSRRTAPGCSPRNSRSCTARGLRPLMRAARRTASRGPRCRVPVRVSRSRAVSASGARTNAAVPSHAAPSSHSSGPYAISSSLPRGGARSAACPIPRPVHQVPAAVGPAAGEVPHRAPQRVAPPAQHTSRYARPDSWARRRRRHGRRPGQAGRRCARCRSACSSRFGPRGELRREPVHVLSVLPAARRAAPRGPVSVVAEELHVHSLTWPCGGARG